MKKKIIKNRNKIILFASFIVLLNILCPNPQFKLKEGEISPRDIIAPYTFYIKKDKKELSEEIKKANESLYFVLEKKDIYNEIKNKVDEFFALFEKINSPKDIKNYITKRIPAIDDDCFHFLLKNRKNVKDSILILIKSLLDKGVIASKAPISSFYVEIVGKDTSYSNKEEIIELNQINEILANVYKNSIKLKIFIVLIKYFIQPNITINYKEMQKRKEDAISKISPTKGIVLKGEMIVRAHDIITREVIEKLNSMGIESKGLIFKKAIGRNILYLIALFVLLSSIYLFKPAILGDIKKISIIIIIITIITGITSLVINVNLPKYIIPIGGAGFLISLLIGGEAGFCSILTIPIIMNAYSPGDIESILLTLFVGILSILISYKIKKVSEFYKTIIYFVIGYVIITLALELIKLSGIDVIFKFTAWSIIGGIGSSFIAFVLLPLFEKIFKITTPITLLEYTDTNHPLLVDLATYASGTYNHSITVAQLAEAAARSIKADTLLAKVGAYYHDIGKIKKPKYFIENQSTPVKINPELYRVILISHVKDGVELAEENNLPNEIINIIKEHHGTTLIEYFFKQSKLENQETQEIDFRYPGPLPSTKESAIVMLADAVESATRSASPISPNKLMSIIENIIQNRLEDGQLSNVNITLDEIKKIEKSFLPILIGIFHKRIEY